MTCRYPVPRTSLFDVATLCRRLCCNLPHAVQLTHPCLIDLESKQHQIDHVILHIFHIDTSVWRINLEFGDVIHVATGRVQTVDMRRHGNLFKALRRVSCRLLNYIRRPQMQHFYHRARYTIPPLKRKTIRKHGLERLRVEQVLDTESHKYVNLVPPTPSDTGTRKLACRYVMRRQEECILQLVDKADAIVVSCYMMSRQPFFDALAQKDRVFLLCHKTNLVGPTEARSAQPFLKRLAVLRKQSRQFQTSELRTSVPWLERTLPRKTLPLARCVGAYQDSFTTPLMHDKTVIALRKKKTQYIPFALWTGTNNFTENATRSIGAGTLIEDPHTAMLRLNDILNYTLSSEPIPWRSQRLQPQWRQVADDDENAR